MSPKGAAPDPADSSEPSAEAPSPIGESVEAAVDELVAGTDRDRAAVRDALEPFVEDGTVTAAAVDEALSETAKVVSTAETRTEFAGIDLEDAREAATDAPDVAPVRTRFEAFEARLSAVEERATDLTPRLQSLVTAHREGRLYDLVTGLEELSATAEDVQFVADELGVEIQEFERWLGSPVARRADLEEDVDAVAGTLTAIEDATEEVAAGEGERPGAVWADARLRLRPTELLCADLRAELDVLAEWDVEGETPEAEDVPTLEDLRTRLEALSERLESARTRVEEVCRPAWAEEYGDIVASCEAELADVEPPVPWGEVQATLDHHRESALPST